MKVLNGNFDKILIFFHFYKIGDHHLSCELVEHRWLRELREFTRFLYDFKQLYKIDYFFE